MDLLKITKFSHNHPAWVRRCGRLDLYQIIPRRLVLNSALIRDRVIVDGDSAIVQSEWWQFRFGRVFLGRVLCWRHDLFADVVSIISYLGGFHEQRHVSGAVSGDEVVFDRGYSLDLDSQDCSHNMSLLVEHS